MHVFCYKISVIRTIKHFLWIIWKFADKLCRKISRPKVSKNFIAIAATICTSSWSPSHETFKYLLVFIFIIRSILITLNPIIIQIIVLRWYSATFNLLRIYLKTVKSHHNNVELFYEAALEASVLQQDWCNCMVSDSNTLPPSHHLCPKRQNYHLMHDF